ncbi:MAG: sensor histidine kinase [Parvularculaceae bacterium]
MLRSLSPFAAIGGPLLTSYANGMGGAATARRARIEAAAARAAAELSIKARAELLANMNHELRTPLNAIIGFATMLRDGDQYDLTGEQRAAYAEYVLQSADLLLGHINTLLELAALDGGELELEENNVDVDEAVRAAMSRAEVAAAARDVTLTRKDGAGEARVWGDAARLGQALDHVLRTAIKLSPKGGTVLVRAQDAERGWSEIAVRDHGAGLSPEALDQALNAFCEPQRGLDRSFAEPGIGLAVAKTFVELQGGRFTVKSRVGEGTLVRLAFPPTRADSAAAPMRRAS